MNKLFNRLLTLCIGLSIGILVSGGPRMGTAEEAPPASTAAPQQCVEHRVYKKGPGIGRAEPPTEQQLLWMARAMYVESGTTYGMIRVGETVLNRMRSKQHHDDLHAVVTKRWAYTGITVNLLDVRSLGLEDYRSERWREAIRMAHAVLTMPRDLRALPPDTRHYFNPDEVDSSPQWAKDELMVGNGPIGAHQFYARVNAGTSLGPPPNPTDEPLTR